MQMITQIVRALILKENFLEIGMIFRKKNIPISDFNKIYVKSKKKPISKFIVYYTIITGINILSLLFLSLNIFYGIITISVFTIIYYFKYMKNFDFCVEYYNGKVVKFQIPYYLKSETIEIIRSVRKINKYRKAD